MADWIKTAGKLARAACAGKDPLVGRPSDIDALLDVSINEFPTKELRNQFKAVRRRLGTGATAKMTPSARRQLVEDVEMLLQDFMLHSKISADLVEGLCPRCKKWVKANVFCSKHNHWEYYALP